MQNKFKPFIIFYITASGTFDFIEPQRYTRKTLLMKASLSPSFLSPILFKVIFNENYEI